MDKERLSDLNSQDLNDWLKARDEFGLTKYKNAHLKRNVPIDIVEEILDARILLERLLDKAVQCEAQDISTVTSALNVIDKKLNESINLLKYLESVLPSKVSKDTDPVKRIWFSKQNCDLSKIIFVFSDLDGVLTDGGVILANHENLSFDELKRVFTRDGQGFSNLKDKGYHTGIITGSDFFLSRWADVGGVFSDKSLVNDYICSTKNKLEEVLEILGESKYQDYTLSNVAYIGDDIFDIPLLENVGFSACPQDANNSVKEHVDYICKNKGGHGAFREFADLILEVDNCKEGD